MFDELSRYEILNMFWPLFAPKKPTRLDRFVMSVGVNMFVRFDKSANAEGSYKNDALELVRRYFRLDNSANEKPFRLDMLLSDWLMLEAYAIPLKSLWKTSRFVVTVVGRKSGSAWNDICVDVKRKTKATCGTVL